MTRLNCPNCGAPIDIHRRDCEYCGTPYDLKDLDVLYADNQPIYIHQDPIEWNDDQIRNLSAQIARGMSKTAWSLDTEIKMLQSQMQANELQMWQEQRIKECCNSLPKVSYGSLVKPEENDMPLFGRILICFGIPGLVIITLFILGAFHII